MELKGNNMGDIGPSGEAEKSNVEIPGENKVAASSIIQAKACDTCKVQPSKYCCPGCGAKSCSLHCVKSHKESIGCSGKRVRTEFKPMKELNDNDLISDYALLEEVLQEQDAAKRLRDSLGQQKRYLPPALAAIQKQARNRNIQLLLLPDGMSRRKVNSSYYNKKRKCIFWRVKWIFEPGGTHLVDDKVDENTHLRDVLKAHLESTPEVAPSVRQSLQPFVDAGLEGVHLYTREPSPANVPKYAEISLARPLGAELAGRVVTEFPIIHVVLASEAHKYQTCRAEKIAQLPQPSSSVEHVASI
eukprot:jgi/Mesen1/8864/ME000053S08255